MNATYAHKVNRAIEKLDFATALTIAETAMNKIPATKYHAVLGVSLSGQTDQLVNWINAFYKKAARYLPIRALYFEMNHFTTNTEEWSIDGFAYVQDGGLRRGNKEWLGDFEADTRKTTR